MKPPVLTLTWSCLDPFANQVADTNDPLRELKPWFICCKVWVISCGLGKHLLEASRDCRPASSLRSRSAASPTAPSPRSLSATSPEPCPNLVSSLFSFRVTRPGTPRDANHNHREAQPGEVLLQLKANLGQRISRRRTRAMHAIA